MVSALLLAQWRPYIANLKDGDVLRSPVAIVRIGAPVGAMEVSREGGPVTVLKAVKTLASAPIELKPGQNTIVLKQDNHVSKVKVSYLPAKSGFRVRVVYIQAADEPDPAIMELQGSTKADVIRRISASVKLMQGFCEDHFRTVEGKSKTFTLNYGSDGNVLVDFHKHKETGDSLRSKTGDQLWGQFYGELSKIYDFDHEKILAIMGFTRYDAATQKSFGHTALGGGSFGLFGSGSMRYWPTSVADAQRAFSDVTVIDPKRSFDDSGLRFRAWANASTTIGAMMHEMGHTFGLPHTTDRRCIMSRGFDQFSSALFGTEPGPNGEAKERRGSYWDPVHTARLSLNPYFQPDRPRSQAAVPPIITREGDKVTLSSREGLKLVCVWQDDKPNWSQPLSGTSATFSLAELKKKIGGDKIHIVAVSASGGERTESIDG